MDNYAIQEIIRLLTNIDQNTKTKSLPLTINRDKMLDELRTHFFLSLEGKTGWGKEQVKCLFDECYKEISGGNNG